MRIILTSLQCAPETKRYNISQYFTLIVQLLKFINHKSATNDQDTRSCVSGQGSHVAHKCLIKTHGRVSAAKEVMWHTSVLFTGTAKSPFSTPHISITTRPISIKFTYFMPSIYTTLHTKFEENGRSSL